MAQPPQTAKPVSLALQGGGAHGAFQWGVIDALLEHGGVDIKAVTAASAGAMNAVALTAGLMEGGAEGARERMESFWRAVSKAGGRNVFGDNALLAAAVAPAWLQATPAYRMASTLALSMSPYEFNPLNLNPLKDVLEAQVDFAALRERSPLALYISATSVRESRSRIFREGELTAQHVTASACLPHLYQAVEIDGDLYWDGGYLANPALWPLFYDPTPDDILILSLNPFVREEAPRSPSEIMDRLNEITFNASLEAELRAVAFIHKLLDEDLLTPAAKGRYRRMLIHAITADGRLDDLGLSTKFNTEWSFLTDLKGRGRAAAQAWLETCLPHVGVKGTIDPVKGLR